MHPTYKKWLEDGKPKVFCQCPDHEEIVITKWYKYNGISKYIRGHNNKGKENNSMYGKHHSKESIEKMSKVKEGKHPSKETIEKMSKAKEGNIPWNKGLTSNDDDRILYGKDNGMYGIPAPPNSSHGKGCYYDSCLQGKIWLRSTYELAYAKYLDEHKILYLYENYTYPLGDTTYTPDFFLPQFMKFIEIKGYMRKEAQEKINKFRKQYPWKLEVLFKEDLIKLGISL